MRCLLCMILILIIGGFLWSDVPLNEGAAADAYGTRIGYPVQTPLGKASIADKFIVAAFISILLELLTIAALYKPLLDKSLDSITQWMKLSAIVAGATLFTITILWWVLPHIFHDPVIYLVVGESFAMFGEAVAYKLLIPCRWKVSFVLAAVANLASFLLGYFLMGWIF